MGSLESVSRSSGIIILKGYVSLTIGSRASKYGTLEDLK